MEAKENPGQGPGTEIAAENAADVSGGDCTTVSVGPVTVSGSGSVGDALISIYDGAVSATSHVIETVANAAK
ncbi:MAG TPA: hypothetical protein VN782_18015 [Usitatibacter sp.]|nr:hypothetical protein [Usitatibacter sp.]